MRTEPAHAHRHSAPPQTYQVARYVHALPAFVARDLRRPHLLPPGVREVIKEADKPAKQGVVLACLASPARRHTHDGQRQRHQHVLGHPPLQRDWGSKQCVSGQGAASMQ